MNPKIFIKEFVKKTLPKESSLYRFLARMNRRPLTDFYDSGFHGDTYLVNFALHALKNAEQYVETGASNGSTLVFVAKKFPNIRAWSCEPDKESYAFSREKTKDLQNVNLSKEMSPEFLYNLVKNNPGLTEKDTLFWLDAHANGFSWPLKKEVEFITSNFDKAYIFIDDFLVPNRPWFGYDAYDGQICSMDFISDSLDKKHSYTVYYPTYQDRTSSYCKLRGWVLIEFGHKKPLSIPPALLTKVEQISHAA